MEKVILNSNASDLEDDDEESNYENFNEYDLNDVY